MNDRAISIDVVTICYNSYSTIERCIKSIANNREYINRYILIDGGSSDGSLDIIDKYKNYIDIFVSEKDNGISEAFNKGLSKCTGDFILLLNSDDWFFDCSMKSVLGELKKNDDVVCTLLTSVINEKENGVFRSNPYLIPKYNSMLHPGAIVNRKLYSELGGYDQGLRVAMDYDFFCRCYNKNKNFRLIDKKLVLFSEGGVSRQLKYYVFRESFYIRRKYFHVLFPVHEIIQLFSRYVGDVLSVFGLKIVVKNLIRQIQNKMHG